MIITEYFHPVKRYFYNLSPIIDKKMDCHTKISIDSTKSA